MKTLSYVTVFVVAIVLGLGNGNDCSAQCSPDTTWLPQYNHCESWFQEFGTTWHGNEGVAYQVLMASDSCDSVVARHYKRHVYDFRDDTTICAGDSVLIFGEWQTEAATYYDNHTNSYGCDSNYTFYLYTLVPDYDTISSFLIGNDSIYVNGSWYSQTTTLDYSLSSVQGCDSVYVRHNIHHISGAGCSQAASSNDWYKQLGGLNDESLMDFATDQCMNTYAIIRSKSHVVYAGTQQALTNGNDEDWVHYLMKFNADGDFIWSKTLPGQVTSLAISVTDKLALTGTFEGVEDFDLRHSQSEYLTATEERDIYIALYDLNANLQWVRQIRSWRSKENWFSRSYDHSGDIIFGMDDEVIVTGRTGSWSDTVDYDPSPTTDKLYKWNQCSGCGSQRFSHFYLQLDANGNFLRRRLRAAASSGCNITAGRLKNSGKLTMSYDGTVYWALKTCGYFPALWNGGTPHFVVFDITSGIQHVLSFDAGISPEYVYDIETDHEGNIYIMGGFYYEIDLNPNAVGGELEEEKGTGAGASGFASQPTSFIGKFSKSGEFIQGHAMMRHAGGVWAPVFHSAPGTDMSVVNGSIFLTGHMAKSIDMDFSSNNHTLPKSAGGVANQNRRWDVYIVQYDHNFDLVHGWGIGGNGNQLNARITKDRNGFLRSGLEFLTNVVTDMDSLNSPTVPSRGEYDVFLNAYRGDTTTVYAEWIDSVTICPADTYYFNGQAYNDTGTYLLDTAYTNSFFHTKRILVLRHDSAAPVHMYDTLYKCADDTITLHDSLIVNLGIVEFNESGTVCDTTFHYSIESLETESQVHWEVYQGDSVFLGGQLRHSSGIYIDTLQNSNGCDSVRYTVLNVIPVNRDTTPVSICQGDTFQAGNVSATTAGNYTDTVMTNGTAVVTVYQLQVLSTNTYLASDTIQEGDSVFLAGAWQIEAGTYCDTHACDSIVCTELLVEAQQDTIIDTIQVSVCEGQSYLAGGAAQTTSGTYIDTISNQQVLHVRFTELTVTAGGVAAQLVNSNGILKCPYVWAANYSWYNCDNAQVIDSGIFYYYFPQQVGNYAVILNENGCADTSNCVWVGNTYNYKTGYHEGEPILYPTAAKDQVFIQLNSLVHDLQVKVYDATGQLVHVQDEQEVALITINTFSLEAGVYLIELTTDHQKHVLKFLRIRG